MSSPLEMPPWTPPDLQQLSEHVGTAGAVRSGEASCLLSARGATLVDPQRYGLAGMSRLCAYCKWQTAQMLL